MKKLFCIFVLMISLLSLTSCRSQVLEKAQETTKQYNEQLTQYKEKTSEYNQAVEQITKVNKDIEDEINKAQTAIDKGETPFDEKTLTTLKDSMGKADKVKASVPEKLPEYKEMKVDEEAKTDDIKAMIEKAEEDMEAMEKCEVPETPAIPDASKEIKTLSADLKAYEDSIQSLKQVTAPSDDFIKSRLKTIKTITAIDAVTEDHDPNGQLNKQGGYIGCTYFADKRIDRSELYIEDGKDNVIDIGTEGGGAIEVFNTKEEAEVRDSYLGGFDGMGSMSSGSHHVIGTIIIRTSTQFKASEQNKLTEDITKALTKVE